MASTVFGVELEFLLQREATGGEVQPGAIPSVVERLIGEVESRGLMEVGICTYLYFDVHRGQGPNKPLIDRIAGAHSEVNALRDALNRGWCRLLML